MCQTYAYKMLLFMFQCFCALLVNKVVLDDPNME